MSKTFRPWDLEQRILLSVHELVPAGHMAHFVRDTVREDLDLSRIMETYSEERGYPPYHPAMMLALLLYAYSRGVYSSRKIAQIKSHKRPLRQHHHSRFCVRYLQEFSKLTWRHCVEAILLWLKAAQRLIFRSTRRLREVPRTQVLQQIGVGRNSAWRTKLRIYPILVPSWRHIAFMRSDINPFSGRWLSTLSRRKARYFPIS